MGNVIKIIGKRVSMLLEFFEMSVTKPHHSFPYLAVHLGFHPPLDPGIMALELFC